MQVVNVPYSEAACFLGLAGQTHLAIEEDQYVNGRMILPSERYGCYVNGHSLAKSEAGWRNDLRKFLIRARGGSPGCWEGEPFSRTLDAVDKEDARNRHAEAWPDSTVLFVREVGFGGVR
jgi:hypothetical protein